MVLCLTYSEFQIMVINTRLVLVALFSLQLAACGGGDGGGSSSNDTVDLNTSPALDANAGTSYTHSKPDLWISYNSLSRPQNSGNLSDAIAYLDADNDGDTDIFMATGEYLLAGEVDSVLYINNGANSFASSTSEFSDSMPPATHARKSIVGDFDGNGLDDIFVFDHGYDAHPFPGSNPKLIFQDAAGTFSWTKLTAQTGFYHGGASADIDNDGDIDIFVGGFNPFFYINDGTGNLSYQTNRFDGSIDKVFSAELIDVDEDGFVDLLVGAHERDGDNTSIYWGSSTGSFNHSNRTIIPAVQYFGGVMDFDAEDTDNDGDRDLLINRTRDGDDGPGKGFYQGRTIQLLAHDGNRGFTDITSTHIDQPGGDNDSWFPWLRVQDVDSDGDVDMASDDAGDNVAYLNEGGVFTRQ